MSLRGEHIVMLSLFRFDNQLASTGLTLAKYLSNENTVYYIDNPFTYTDGFRERKSEAGKVRQGYTSGKTDGIFSLPGYPSLKVVLSPLLLPIHFLPEGKIYRRLLRHNEQLIRNRIREVLVRFGVKDYIYLNSFQFHYPNVAKGLKPAVKIYHCLDPVHTPFDRKHGFISEKILVQQSDLVICSSQQLYEEKIVENHQTYFIPNAADVNHSRKALDPALQPAAFFRSIPKPVVGYFGSIEHRFDFALLQRVIPANRDKSFVFVGPVIKEQLPDWFLKAENVFLEQPVTYEELPAVLKGFDIAIIPFRKYEVSRTVFPLKLFEYLGAGKPVVATDFNPDLERFTKNTVTFCADAETFSAALQTALQANHSTEIASRLEIAEENTWDKRTAQIEELIEHFLTLKRTE